MLQASQQPGIRPATVFLSPTASAPFEHPASGCTGAPRCRLPLGKACMAPLWGFILQAYMAITGLARGECRRSSALCTEHAVPAAAGGGRRPGQRRRANASCSKTALAVRRSGSIAPSHARRIAAALAGPLLDLWRCGTLGAGAEPLPVLQHTKVRPPQTTTQRCWLCAPARRCRRRRRRAPATVVGAAAALDFYHALPAPPSGLTGPQVAQPRARAT